MNRLPSLVPVLTGALGASAGALLLLGWHGRPLTGAFVIAASALALVPLILLFRIAAPGATPRHTTTMRRRLPARLPATAFPSEHGSYTGGLDDAGLAALVGAWADADVWARSSPANESRTRLSR